MLVVDDSKKFLLPSPWGNNFEGSTIIETSWCTLSLAFFDNKICLETQRVGGKLVSHFEMVINNVKDYLIGKLKRCLLNFEACLEDKKVHISLLCFELSVKGP